MKCLQIGLTGSIGMGKSVISNQFKLLGFPIFCADETVHKLYSLNGKAVNPISEIFPETLINNSIDRQILSKIVLDSPDLLKKIEQIVHPLVMIERDLFYKNACINNHFLVVYDIPLLYENIKNYSDLDYIIVATANEDIQKQRVLSRKNMTIEKFESILSKQIPDNIKRQKANYIIKTDYSLNTFAATRSQIAIIIESLILKHPQEWSNWKNRSHFKHDSLIDENIVEKNNININSVCNNNSSIKDLFDLVIFDLDDTLLPYKGPIIEASIAVNEFMEKKMPQTFQYIKDTNYKEIMSLIIEDIPYISHDYTELRREYLKYIISTNCIENEHIYIEESIEVFLRARSNVGTYLYHDTIDCLEWLKNNNIKIAILTNGNANILLCNVLNKYADIYMNAGDIGSSKPSPIAFISIVQCMNIIPSRILMVGDNYNHDIIGAKNVGLKTAYLIRDERESNDTDKTITKPDKCTHSDIILNNLTPHEFELKISQYIQNFNNKYI